MATTEKTADFRCALQDSQRSQHKGISCAVQCASCKLWWPKDKKDS